MDEVVKKVAGLGLPGIILVVLIATSGGNSLAVMTLLAGLGGPLGIVGGLGLLGLVGAVGEIVTGYGLEAILTNIYTERSKTESTRLLLKEIKDLPITEELKLKLKQHLSPKTVDTDPDSVYEVPQEPRTVEIVEESV